MKIQVIVERPLTKEIYKKLNLSNTKVKNEKELFCHIIGTPTNFCYDVEKKVLYCYAEDQLVKEVFPGEMSFDEFKYRRTVAMKEALSELAVLN